MKNKIYSLAWTTVLSHKRLTIGMMIFIILSILTALLPPLVLEQIVRQLSLHQDIALPLIGSYFLCIALARLFEVGQNRQITRFGQKMMHCIRSAMSQKLNRLPAQYFTVYDAASLTSRFVNDVEALDALFTNGIISMFADVFKMLSVLGVIWIKSKELGMLLLMVLPGLFYLTRCFQKRMLKAQLQNRQAIAQVNSYIPEAIQNSRMITQYHCQEFMEKRYDVAVEASYQAIEKANMYDSYYSPIILVISSCVIALMMVMAAVGQGKPTFFGIDAASAVAIIAYINELFAPLENIGMEIQNIQSAVAGVKRMNEFLNETEREGNDLPAQFEGDSVIRFDHVTFGYGAEKILVDLCFDIKKNEIITLTGPSGAGKSTILKLICGFYQPQEGHVWINDVEAYRIQDQDKRHLFGYMKQSFDPLVGTIKDQISCFDATFSDQQIQDVLAFVGLKATVDSFSKGMDTPFESSLFSQGQLQLLSLARAIVGNPSILLLDEMSANLDSKTQQIIQEALHKASQNRTVISISHRNFELDALSRQIKIK